MVRHVATAGGDLYQCSIISGCSWQETDADVLGMGGEAPASTYAVHIPEETVPEQLPTPGDYMLLGRCETVATRTDLEALPHFRVARVTDNRRGIFLRHVKVVGA